MTPEQVRHLADGLPVSLACCWLISLVAVFRKLPRKSALVFVAVSLVAWYCTWTVVDYFQGWKPFPRFPGFPSGHEAFAASFATSAVIADRRWLPVAVVLTIATAPVVVWARMHQWPDVIASAIYSPLVTLLFHRLFGSGIDYWKVLKSRDVPNLHSAAQSE